MSVVWFISGHGFGHASREVEILNALTARRPELRPIVRTAVQPGLLARTLTGACELRPGACDTGIIQSSSVAHDDAATAAAARAFYATYDARVAAEAAALEADEVRLVVGDIPPLAFDVAARLGVPSVAIANFTWDWIYATHPGLSEDQALLDTIRAAYQRATLALELPFAGGFDVFPEVRAIPLVARHATQSRTGARRHFGLPADGRVALLSFGGYGLPALELSSVDCLDHWTVVTTDRVAGGEDACPPGVVFLPEAQFLGDRFRYEDLVAAVDVVITKPGYGIIAECIASGTAMLYTSRGEFREYDLLVRELPRYLRAGFIDHADLFAGRWRAHLDALLAQAAPPDTMATNGAEIAARIVADLYDGLTQFRT